MTTEQHVNTDDVRAGDWIEADSPGGSPPRRGQILEVIGGGAHRHYRVRWDEAHESLFYPTDGARIYRDAIDNHARRVRANY
ncbi:MAG TPA: DUF1918 domain-containing protein [Solirubrobacteraceae bacterium]|nr:DUF1918 domain-containing protein [Solirubrobacteraceae bacterium]